MWLEKKHLYSEHLCSNPSSLSKWWSIWRKTSDVILIWKTEEGWCISRRIPVDSCVRRKLLRRCTIALGSLVCSILHKGRNEIAKTELENVSCAQASFLKHHYFFIFVLVCLVLDVFSGFTLGFFIIL